MYCRDDDYEELDDPDNAPMSVVKIQVGLLGTARELQKDLNRMGNSVDTSSPGGLHYLLQETVLALRRNPQYAMYGMYSMDILSCPTLVPAYLPTFLSRGGCPTQQYRSEVHQIMLVV